MQWFNRKAWISVLLVAAFGLVEAGATDVELEAVPAKLQIVEREQVFNGTVEAVQQTTVSAQTGGRISSVEFDVDDYVTKGDIVARIRDVEQRAGLEQAEAGLQEARTRVEQADAEYERVSEVYEKKLISKARLDDAKAERDAARARYEAAKAKLESAREQLEHTLIRAPYSGIVTQRHVETGESVNPGQPVMSGVSLEKLRIKVAIPQRLINRVRDIRKARVILEHASQDALPAAELTFFPYADSRTNSFDVRVDLPEEVEGLFPGMSVKVAFVTGKREQLVVPISSVVYRSEVTGVYVVRDDGTIVLRQVRAGRTTAEGMVEVLAGLSGGDSVALDPIRAGAKLKDQLQGDGRE